MNIFITSDEHYGHARIITLAKRPFSCVEEMNERIVDQHNRTVSGKMTNLTIHAGDLFWHTMSVGDALQLLGRLNGRHAFLYGNHDELIAKSEILRANFLWVKGENRAGGAHILTFNKRDLTVSHFARRVWQGSHSGNWHVYGHSHSALPGLGKSFDIGVDGHNFAPWSLDEIETRMDVLTPHHSINNTGEGTEDVLLADDKPNQYAEVK